MTWQNEVIECVRATINDLDEPYTYLDARIERLSVVAAAQVIQEADFDNSYSVDINAATITPDPTDSTPKDNAFIALLALKTAILIVRAELKGYAAYSGINVTDGPSSISTTGLFKNFSDLLKQLISDYENLKKNYKLLASADSAKAILTPTTVRHIYTNVNVLPY